jgi:ADP-heptose:LPS heptosyltransferase
MPFSIKRLLFNYCFRYNKVKSSGFYVATLLENIKSVLIIRSGALGDLVYSTAVMDALLAQYGQTVKIDWVCTPGAATLLQKDPRVRQVFLLKHRKLPVWLSSEKRTIVSYSEKHPYDLLINLESGKIFYSLAKGIHARHKIGMPYTLPAKNPNAAHMVDIIKNIYADIIDPEILQKSNPKLFGEATEIIREKYALPEHYIVLNPSNSHNNSHRLNYRAWPQEHWRDLIGKLSSRVPLVITANKGEESYFEKIRPFPSNVIDLVGKTPLIDLIGVIDNADAVVSTDTGPAHIASAVNTPVYTLIGPTPHQLTGPYKHADNEVHIIRTGIACSPCYNTPVMFECNDNRCMKEISVEMVLKALEPVLAEIN